MTERIQNFRSLPGDDTIEEMFNAGATLPEIADAVGRSLDSARARCRRLGLVRLKFKSAGVEPGHIPMTCICCRGPFMSVDRRRNRMCTRCRGKAAGAPDECSVWT